MKKILIILAAVSICQYAAAQAVTARNFNKLKWLAGTWNRTNAKAGRLEKESWSLASATELNGSGFMIRGNDTLVVEKLKILVKDNSIFYAADVKGNNGIVYFKLTSLDSNGFSCENPEHDFPKKIVYLRQGRQLKATISGNGKSIDYLFEKEL